VSKLAFKLEVIGIPLDVGQTQRDRLGERTRASYYRDAPYLGTSGVQRWGGYSSVTMDPLDGTKAWIINEKINNSSTWGTAFGGISF